MSISTSTKAYWPNPMTIIVDIAAVVIRNDEGKFLLVQEGQPKVRGLWNLPAGHVDAGETPQEAAIREALEETGYAISLKSTSALLDLYKPGDTHHIFIYSGTIRSGQLHVDGEEILDAQWYSTDEISALMDAGALRKPWVYDATCAYTYSIS